MFCGKFVLLVMCLMIRDGGSLEKRLLHVSTQNEIETKMGSLESMFMSCNSSISKLQDFLIEEQLKFNKTYALLMEILKRQSEQITSLESKVNNSTQHMVGFTACHTNGDTLGSGQTVKYDHVLTNIGKAYDARDGEFNVPFDGLYTLSVKLVAYFHTSMYAVLMRNGEVVHQIYSNGDEADSTELTLNLYLQAGDTVWIENQKAGDRLHPYEYNCFSGMLTRG